MKRHRPVQHRRSIWLFAYGLYFLILSGCILRPEWQQIASEGDLDSSWIDTSEFRHLLLSNNRRDPHLRIYIEGDGTPWIRENRVAVDPTPPNPVLLRLMLKDNGAATYLGRPCYFGTATARECNERWWTFERYSETVIDSMCEAANEISGQLAAQSVQLVGFSGGGAIVLGMSRCTSRLVSITTVAGNLDPAAWTEYHGYSRLIDASIPPVSVAEAHWQCEADNNVPPSITDNFFESRIYAGRHIVKDCTHATGWGKYWSRIVESPRAD